MITLGHMVLKGFNWVHNDKIRSYGIERGQLGTQYKMKSYSLEMRKLVTQCKNHLIWS